jgi:hypothetical protein
MMEGIDSSTGSAPACQFKLACLSNIEQMLDSQAPIVSGVAVHMISQSVGKS